MIDFDWKKFYYVGLHLMDYSDNEEYQRSAIGRFYYACFGIAKQYFEDTREHVLPSVNSHSILIKEFEKSNFRIERQLGQYLRHIRRYRNNSDYDLRFRPSNVRKSKNIATAVFAIFTKLDKHPLYKK